MRFQLTGLDYTYPSVHDTSNSTRRPVYKNIRQQTQPLGTANKRHSPILTLCASRWDKSATGGAVALPLVHNSGEGLDTTMELLLTHTNRSQWQPSGLDI